MTDQMLEALQHMVRTHQLNTLTLASLVIFGVAGIYLLVLAIDAIETRVRRALLRRRVRRALQGGVSHYADPARLHREIQQELERLAGRVPGAHAAVSLAGSATRTGSGDRSGATSAGVGSTGPGAQGADHPVTTRGHGNTMLVFPRGGRAAQRLRH